MPNPKSRSWNKKNTNKNMTNAKQKFNWIFLQEWNKNITKLWQENVPKTNVEQTEGNGELYFYLYLLGTYFKKVSQETFNLHVTHVHPCIPMYELRLS